MTGNRIGPCRSACAVHVTSYNDKRESIYTQQQTISGDGLSGIAFSTNVPHTVRGGPPRTPELRNPDVHRHIPSETKMCTDCHVSAANDNNAYMATLLMQGSNFVNFMGRFCWVAAGEDGFEGVVVTERDEPQAVIGSTLHKLAYPERYHEHVKHKRELEHAHEHPGIDIGDKLLHPLKKPEILSVQARGEFLLAACGNGRAARVRHRLHRQQRFLRTNDDRSRVAARAEVLCEDHAMRRPSRLRRRWPRTRRACSIRRTTSSAIHPMYGYVYVADKYEGLILVGVATAVGRQSDQQFPPPRADV